MANRRSIARRVIVVSVSLITTLLVALIAVLHVSATLNWIGDLVEDVTNESLEGTLTLGSISGSLFGELVITDARMTAPDGTPIVAIERITASVSLTQLLSRGVEVEIEGEGATAFLRLDADGELNLLQALPRSEPDEPSSDLPVWLDLRIHLPGASVVWRDDAVAAPSDDPLAAIDAATTATQRRVLADTITSPTSPPRSLPNTILADELTADVRVVVARDQVTSVVVDRATFDLAAHGWTPPRASSLTGVSLAIDDDALRVVAGGVEIDDWLEVEQLRAVVPEDLERLALHVSKLHATQSLLNFVAPEAGLRTSLTVGGAFAPANAGSRYAISVQPAQADPLVIVGELSGWVEPGPTTTWSAALKTKGIEPAAITTIAEPLHRLGAAIEIEGRGFAIDELEATARVAAHSVDVERYRIESAFAALSFANQRLHVDRAFIETPYASVAARLGFGLNGAFDVTVRAESTDAVKQLATRLFQRKISSQADIAVDAHGRLDLTAAEPLEMLRSLDADVIWNINEFSAEDVQIQRSQGDVTARIDTEGSVARLDLTGIVSGRSIRTADLSLRSVSADVRASSSGKIASPNVMELIKHLTARVDVDLNGFDAADALVRDVDLLLTVAPSGGRLRYDLRGSAARIAAGDVRIADAAAKLKGRVTLGDTLEWPGVLRAFDAKGNASARGVDASGDAVSSLDATIEIGGPIANLKGRIEAKTTGLKVADYAFTRLDAQVDFVGDRLFEVNAQGEQADRKPAELGVFVRGRHNRELTDFEVLELRFDGTGETWNLSDGFSFGTQAGDVRFDDVTLTHGDQSVHIDGEFRPGRDQDLDVDVQKLDLAKVVQDFGLVGLQPLRGKLTAQAELAGTSTEPTVRFDVHLDELYWENFGPFELRAEGRYGDRELVVESFALDGYASRLLEGNATLPLRVTTTGEFEVLQGNAIDAFLETPGFDPTALYELVPALAEAAVTGGMAMTTRLGGTLMNPRLNSEVRLTQVVARPKVDSQNLSIGPVDSTLAVRYSDPGSDNGGLEITLNAAWAGEPPIQLLARVQADVAAWTRETLDGGQVDWVSRFTDAPWRFVGRAQRFDLRNVRVGPMADADVEGFVTIAVIGDGSLAAPQANFEIKLDQFGWGRYRDIFFDADLAIQKDRAVLKRSRFEWDADEILTASGTIPIPFNALFGNGQIGDLPIDFELQLQPTKLAKLSAVDYSFASLQGMASGFVTMGGSLAAPTFETRVALQDLIFADQSKGAISVDAALTSDKRANGRIQWARDGKPTLAATAALPLDVDFLRIAAGEELNLTGDFSASIRGEKLPLAGLIPRRIFDEFFRDVAGQLDTSLDVSGTLQQPKFDGSLKVSDGKLTIPEFKRTFQDVQIDVTANPTGSFTLQQLNVRGEQGTLGAQGTLRHVGWKPAEVDGDVEIRNLGTSGFTDFVMFVSADARLDGSFASQPATARAVVSNVDVVMPDMSDQSNHATGLDADIVVIRSDKDREALYAIEGALDPVSSAPFLELGIEIEKGAKIRHPMATVQVMGDLTLQLSESGPVLYGEAMTTSGKAQVLGKAFEIQQAIVTFTGSDPPDPRLQIEAVYFLEEKITNQLGQPTSGQPRAIVRVTGRSSDPQIRFRSDPGMPESDVIYVIMTGRLPGQGGVGEAGIAAGAASGLLTNLIAESPVGQIVDVEVKAGDEGLTDASIEVGRYIGRDVFISLDLRSTVAADENTSELNIEYRFAPRWIFEFQAGNRGTGEAAVFWEIY